MVFKIRLEELVSDAAKFCENNHEDYKKCEGLLIVKGNDENAEKIRRRFIEVTGGRYPVFIERQKDYENKGGRVREGTLCYTIDLTQIELI